MTGAVWKRLGGITALGAVLALMAGCDGDHVKGGGSPGPRQPAETWDLRSAHTSGNINWPSGAGSAFERSGLRVRVLFPEGKVFQDRIQRVTALKYADSISSLDFYYPPATTTDAYRLAQRLGKEWNIDLRNLDAWYQRRMKQRAAGNEDFTDTALTGGPSSRPLGGPGGPAPTIEMLNSFASTHPVVVNLSFFWPR
jgi:hypothetical protein